jgi:hypothetical protein
MQIARQVACVLSSDPSKIKVSDFTLPFVPKETSKPAAQTDSPVGVVTQETLNNATRAAWLAMAGYNADGSKRDRDRKTTRKPRRKQ